MRGWGGVVELRERRGVRKVREEMVWHGMGKWRLIRMYIFHNKEAL